MTNGQVAAERREQIAVAAHDSEKPDLVEWGKYSRGVSARHSLCAIRTTGKI